MKLFQLLQLQNADLKKDHPTSLSQKSTKLWIRKCRPLKNDYFKFLPFSLKFASDYAIPKNQHHIFVIRGDFFEIDQKF